MLKMIATARRIVALGMRGSESTRNGLSCYKIRRAAQSRPLMRKVLGVGLADTGPFPQVTFYRLPLAETMP
jgi:hypothetical protein